LPNQADIWWMSQFLDCFSEEQIVSILSLIHQHMHVKHVVNELLQWVLLLCAL